MLLCAGIGATLPLVMLHELGSTAARREVWWRYGTRSHGEHPFAGGALLGDLIAGHAVTHGWEGVVIYGCVRDCVALKALSRSAVLPACPGDRLTADEDGIVHAQAAT